MAAKSERKEKLFPIGDRVAISPLDEPDTKGMIVVPESAKSKPTRGVIIAVGIEAQYIKVGDVVVFGKYSGTDVEIDGKEVVLMHEDDVIAIVKDAK